MADQLGIYATGTILEYFFTTHSSSGSFIAPSAPFDEFDFYITKNGGSFRTSHNGISVSSPLAASTGLHWVAIDLADNTDPGFYAANSYYSLMLLPSSSGPTVDGIRPRKVLAYFSTGAPAESGLLVGNVNVVSANDVPWNSGAIDANTLASNTIAAAKIATSAFAGSKFATGCFNNEKFTTDCFDNDNFADGSIGIETLSAGLRGALQITDEGQAQSVSPTTITLRAAFSANAGVLVGQTIFVYSSTNGTYSSRRILSWDNGTKIATVDGWDQQPTGTVLYTVIGTPPDQGKVRAINGDTTNANILEAFLATLHPTSGYLEPNSLSPEVCNKLADHFYRRSMSGVMGSSYGDPVVVTGLYGFLAQAQHSEISGLFLTIKHPDGSTLGVLPVATGGVSNPIVGIGG